MPSLIDVLADHVTRVLQDRPLPPQARAVIEAAQSLFANIGCILLQIAATPVVPGGYRDRLVEHGSGTLGAQGLALLTVHSGKRRARDSVRKRAAVKAVRFFEGPNRSRAAVVRNAATILAAWRETSVIETLFIDAGRDVFEFIRLIERAAAGDLTPCERLRQIVIDLEPILRLGRGRKISAASEAHQILLGQLKELGIEAAYTWSDLEGDFVDVWTRATRLEFNDPDFSPQSAHRRLKQIGVCRPRA